MRGSVPTTMSEIVIFWLGRCPQHGRQHVREFPACHRTPLDLTGIVLQVCDYAWRCTDAMLNYSFCKQAAAPFVDLTCKYYMIDKTSCTSWTISYVLLSAPSATPHHFSMTHSLQNVLYQQHEWMTATLWCYCCKIANCPGMPMCKACMTQFPQLSCSWAVWRKKPSGQTANVSASMQNVVLSVVVGARSAWTVVSKDEQL